jgi:hypothetical protein
MPCTNSAHTRLPVVRVDWHSYTALCAHTCSIRNIGRLDIYALSCYLFAAPALPIYALPILSSPLPPPLVLDLAPSLPHDGP